MSLALEMGIVPSEFLARVTSEDLALLVAVKRRQAEREKDAIDKARAKARAGRGRR